MFLLVAKGATEWGLNMKCVKCGTEQQGNIVHSGVDAFLLGVMEYVERICYACARSKEQVDA